jgi:hypothetical protein
VDIVWGFAKTSLKIRKMVTATIVAVCSPCVAVCGFNSFRSVYEEYCCNNRASGRLESMSERCIRLLLLHSDPFL